MKQKVNGGSVLNFATSQLVPASKISVALKLTLLQTNTVSEGLLANSVEPLIEEYTSYMLIIQGFEREENFQSALDLAVMAYGSGGNAQAIFLIEAIAIVLSYGTLDDARLLVEL